MKREYAGDISTGVVVKTRLRQYVHVIESVQSVERSARAQKPAEEAK